MGDRAARAWRRKIAICAWSAAEKKAAALPPKLTVPMILFFLPVLFAVILTPAIIQIRQMACKPFERRTGRLETPEAESKGRGSRAS